MILLFTIPAHLGALPQQSIISPQLISHMMVGQRLVAACMHDSGARETDQHTLFGKTKLLPKVQGSIAGIPVVTSPPPTLRGVLHNPFPLGQ